MFSPTVSARSVEVGVNFGESASNCSMSADVPLRSRGPTVPPIGVSPVDFVLVVEAVADS